MRLFIAINFSNNTKTHLLILRDALRGQSTQGNFSLPENLHLTLAFLGECDTRQAAAVKQAMSAVHFAPLEMTIDRVGRFRRDSGDLWWCGVRETPALMALQRELHERLLAAGFALEQRRYTPHITLGREVLTDIAPWNIEPISEKVSHVELMQSERIQGRLAYKAIFSREV